MIRILLLSALFTASFSSIANQTGKPLVKTTQIGTFPGFAALPTAAAIRARAIGYTYPQRTRQPRLQIKPRPLFQQRPASFNKRNYSITAPKRLQQLNQDKNQPKTQTNPDKFQFLSMLAPIVEAENKRLLSLRKEVQKINQRAERFNLSLHHQNLLLDLAKQYRVKGNPVKSKQVRLILLEHIDAIPVSLALAQAVNESAWGTSRFAREGNNLFGIWTYDKTKGIVPKGRAEGKTHLVRIFSDYTASVRYYVQTLNSHPAYKSLRDTRAKLREQGRQLNGSELAHGLLKYSAKGQEYVRLIQQIIERYNLAKLDTTNRTRA